jgi:hypothetical protein
MSPPTDTHYTLNLRDRLLMTLMWLKLYLNTSAL